jgi:hypothetical protein
VQGLSNGILSAYIDVIVGSGLGVQCWMLIVRSLDAEGVPWNADGVWSEISLSTDYVSMVGTDGMSI